MAVTKELMYINVYDVTDLSASLEQNISMFRYLYCVVLVV